MPYLGAQPGQLFLGATPVPIRSYLSNVFRAALSRYDRLVIPCAGKLAVAEVGGDGVSEQSAISWTEATWNPTTGCDRVSPGCANCYALAMAKRLKAAGNPRYQKDGGPASGPGFGLTVHPDLLDLPLRWCPDCRKWVVPGPATGRTRQMARHPRLAELFGCPDCGTLTKERGPQGLKAEMA